MQVEEDEDLDVVVEVVAAKRVEVVLLVVHNMEVLPLAYGSVWAVASRLRLRRCPGGCWLHHRCSRQGHGCPI